MSLTIQSGGSLTIQGGGGGGGGGATVGTYASRPAAGNAGAIYICTDSPIAQWVDDGSAWRPMLQGQALGTQVPAASAFTAFGGGSFALADANGTIASSCSSTGQSNLCGGTIAASGASLYVEAAWSDVSDAGGLAEHSDTAVFLRESATGKAAAVSMYSPQRLAPIRGLFTTVFANNTRTAETSSMSRTPAINGPTFCRVRIDGSTVKCEYSVDRRTWFLLYSYAVSSVFSSAPDQVGFGLLNYSSGASQLMHFKYGSL